MEIRVRARCCFNNFLASIRRCRYSLIEKMKHKTDFSDIKMYLST